jgi:hypothetical protein
VSYDAGLVQRIEDLLVTAGIRGARQKNVFGGRGFLLGKSTFVIAWDDSLIVKLARDEYAAVLAEPNVTPFAPDGEKPMSTWVVVGSDAIADDPELVEWLQRGARGVTTGGRR